MAPTVRVPFAFADAPALQLQQVAVVSRATDPAAPHGVSGLARDTEGRLFMITDRPADVGHSVWYSPAGAAPGAASAWGAFDVLPIVGDHGCTSNLEGLRFGADGTLWLASDTAHVGRGRVERAADGRPLRVHVTCSQLAADGLFPREDENAGFEALAVVGDQPYALTEKAVAEAGADSRHRLFRVDFPTLTPVADIVYEGGQGHHIRMTDAVACDERLLFLGTFVSEGARGYFLLSLAWTGDRASQPRLLRIDNPPVADAGPPNLEGLLADRDCSELTFINDDSAGDEVRFPTTLVRRANPSHGQVR